MDKEYIDVRFDIMSGGVSAIHKYHRFDQEKGPYGVKRGDYEIKVVDILRRKGYSIILETERAAAGVKTPDGFINGLLMDIKAVESSGRWAIKDKFHAATKQGVESLILFFCQRDLYSLERITDGWKKYLQDESAQKYVQSIRQVLCVLEEEVVSIDIQKHEKPPNGDFSEGSKGTGGVPLPPSTQR